MSVSLSNTDSTGDLMQTLAYAGPLLLRQNRAGRGAAIALPTLQGLEKLAAKMATAIVEFRRSKVT